MNKKRWLSAVKISAFLLLGITLVWFSFKDLKNEEIDLLKSSLKNANPFWLIFSLVIGMISHIIRAYRWNMLVEPMGYRPRFLNSFYAVMTGYLVNYGVPRLGEISRCTLLTKYEKIPFTKTLGTVIAERVLDIIFFFIVFFLMLVTQYQKLAEYFNTYISPPLIQKWNNILQNKTLFVILIFCLLLIFIFLVMIRNKIRGKFVDKLKQFARGFTEGLSSVKQVKKPGYFIFLTALIWVCYYAGVHIFMYCIPSTIELGFSESLTAFVFGSVMVMITPGGIGAYPYAIQKILLFVYLVPEVTGASIGWLSWLSSFVLIVLVGLFSLLALPFYNKNYQPVVPQES